MSSLPITRLCIKAKVLGQRWGIGLLEKAIGVKPALSKPLSQDALA
jgi:hypothetical protein